MDTNRSRIEPAKRSLAQAIEEIARNRALNIIVPRRSRWQRTPKWARILGYVEGAPGLDLRAVAFAIESTWLCRMRVRLAIEGMRLARTAGDAGIEEVYKGQLQVDRLFFRQYRKQRDKLIFAFRHKL